MNKFLFAGLTGLGLLILPANLHAHGGQYRGPGDVVPPSPGGGRATGGPTGPTTGGPAGPSTPGPAGPATPGPGGPATGGPAAPAAGRGPTTGGGIQLDDDLTRWEFWWEFNKDPFIRLKDAIHTGGVQTGSDEYFLGQTRKVEAKDTLEPSDEDKMTIILPALKKAIDSTEQRDITSSCMVAMAKIGKDHSEFKLREVFAPRLKSKDQEIRETAALAYGIAAIGDEDNLNLLIGLAKDSEAGRKACDRSEVDDRTRAFATYGLGLVAYATANVDVKRKVFDAVKEMVADDKISNRQLKVASVNAVSLLNAKGSSDAEKALVADALKALEEYYVKELGAGQQLMQSHVPPAIAKLIGRDHEKSDHYKDLFAGDLDPKSKGKRTNNDVYRSCALALGQLCKPFDDDKSSDAKYSKLLQESYQSHKDEQTRYFSALALGQIGGKENRAILLKEFQKAKKLEKGWVAIGMGVYAFKKYDAARATQASFDVEKEFGDWLKNSLDEKNPSALAGIVIALGLVQYKDAADAVRGLLNKHAKEDELAGYICIGLALMDDQRSVPEIQDIVGKATRRPDLLKQAAIALGKLGDKNVAEQLQKLMREGEPNLAKLSAVASALGFIGDRRTIEPLKKMLFDDKLSELSRAFAAVALGGVADKEKLPWNSKIGQNLNYRAAVETLTDKVAGILDIL